MCFIVPGADIIFLIDGGEPTALQKQLFGKEKEKHKWEYMGMEMTPG